MSTERKPIPPNHCEYLIRMHLKSIEAISKYMAGGCSNGPLNGPMWVQVALIDLHKKLTESIKTYGDGSYPKNE